MIIVNLKGGLGNQMFQYALGRKLAFKNQDSLKLDTEGLARANDVGDIYRPFALDQFRITASVATHAESLRLKYPFGLLSKIFRRISFKVLRRMHVGWEPSLLNKSGDLYLDGYFQSPNYFEDIRAILLEEYQLKEGFSPLAQDIAARMQGANSVSVHVRRGDYTAAQNSGLGPCSLSYYEKALAYVRDIAPDITLFVFSDDIPWARQNLPLEQNQVEFVSQSGISDQEEIHLMASCKHNIIANSSFSWWGAWLNQNPEKVVVAPEPWFDTNKSDHKDLVPKTWIRLPKN